MLLGVIFRNLWQKCDHCWSIGCVEIYQAVMLYVFRKAFTASLYNQLFFIIHTIAWGCGTNKLINCSLINWVLIIRVFFTVILLKCNPKLKIIVTIVTVIYSSGFLVGQFCILVKYPREGFATKGKKV